MKLAKLLTVAIPVLFWTACSDDSSGSSNPQVPEGTELSSASETQEGDPTTDPTITSSASENPNTEVPSTETPTSSAEAGDPGTTETFVPEELVYDTIGFADIGNAWRNVAPDEKVVFVIRHAERESGVGKESPLTANGELQAQSVGQKLIGGTEDFVFGHTAYVRTEETARNIAIGRGQTTFVHDTISELTGGWFVKDSDIRDSYITKDTNTSVLVSLWAYDGLFTDAFYDLETRSQEVIDTYLVKDYSEMPKAKVIISHDEFVVPLIAYATNKTASIRYHRGRWWVNYLTGVAIIVNSNNEKRYIGIKGLETATE